MKKWSQTTLTWNFGALSHKYPTKFSGTDLVLLKIQSLPNRSFSVEIHLNGPKTRVVNIKSKIRNSILLLRNPAEEPLENSDYICRFIVNLIIGEKFTKVAMETALEIFLLLDVHGFTKGQGNDRLIVAEIPLKITREELCLVNGEWVDSAEHTKQELLREFGII